MKKILIYGAVFLLLCYWCSDGDSSSSQTNTSSATTNASIASETYYWTSNGKKMVIHFETDDYGTIYIEGNEDLKSKFEVINFSQCARVRVNASYFPIYIGNKVYSDMFYIADGTVYPSEQAANTRDTNYPHSKIYKQ